MYNYFYNFVSENLDLFRFLYSAFIALICFLIVLKTDRLFRISLHQGIRYFRNAFLFYGIAFMLRYLLSLYYFVFPFFEFFMVMAGFFLLYSLVWKKFEIKDSRSSFFNPIVFLAYFITLVIILFDFFSQSYNFLFISQIIIFTIATIISFQNLKKQTSFSKLYFIIMVLNLFAWSLNFILIFLSQRLRFVGNIYVLNVIVFLIFLYGVFKVAKKWQRNGRD